MLEYRLNGAGDFDVGDGGEVVVHGWGSHGDLVENSDCSRFFTTLPL
jgi:hypothetical protein